MADSEEKTEQPTPKRLKDFREKGEVARSSEVPFALGFAAWLLVLGRLLPDSVERLLVHARLLFMRLSPETVPIEELYQAGGTFLRIMTPMFLAGVVIAIAANGVPSGWIFVPMKLHPERLNPVEGIKRIFRLDAVWDLARTSLKLGAIAWIVMGEVRSQWTRFLALPRLEPTAIAAAILATLARFTWKLAAILLLFAAADLGIKLWQHMRKLKMSKQEVKEEKKSSEGNPLVKGRIRSLMRRLVKKRSLKDVRSANVVVVNPIHFAVALRYETARMGAPVVVAKGRERLARKIVELARRHGVPIKRDEPLARGLYRSAEVGDAIPSSMFKAVAEVFAWIYRQNPPGRPL